jgi:catechol 2,3-dioxygenase-like lactoylglutathione lyase family enzyme
VEPTGTTHRFERPALYLANVAIVTDGIDRGSGAPITGLSHVQLLVSDVRASSEWYTVALGLEPYVRDFDIGYVALRHRSARMVVVLTAPPHPEQNGGRDRLAPHVEPTAIPGTVDHLAFAVPDGAALQSWAHHLTEIGIDHHGVVLENGNPSLQLRDPDGIAIELVAPGPGRPSKRPVEG